LFAYGPKVGSAVHTCCRVASVADGNPARVLGLPREPKTEMRIEASDVTAIVEPAGLLLNRAIELPPYHYGVVLRRGANE
jgi:hypothetical protein